MNLNHVKGTPLHVKRTAIKMINEAGLINLSRHELCERAGIPVGSFINVMGCNFTEFVQQLKTEIETKKTHPVVKTRTNPELRTEHILNVAVKMSIKQGYDKITRDGIANEAGVSMGLVTRYFSSMKQLRRAVMRHAVNNDIPSIVAQGLINNDPHARKASDELKSKAAALLMK